MEITENLDNGKDEIFPKEKADDFFLQLVRGKDITEKIETKRGIFTVKYPKQKDIIAIGRLVARNHIGIPAECFDKSTELKIQVVSTLEVIVVDGPDWWKNAKAENENWNWGYVPDETFLNELYLKAYDFRAKVDGDFRKIERKEPVGVPSDSSNENTMDYGLFEGLSGSTGNK